MTLNNQLFVRKERLEAVQFTGTVQNSADIIEWLHARGIKSETSTLSTTQLVKGKVVRETTKIIYIHHHGVHTLLSGGWIVETADERYEFLSEFDFEDAFAPVTIHSPV